MEASNSIFRLIKSLTVNERRYFKLYTSTYKGKKENIYTSLFKAIDKQKTVYDEDKLKRKNKGASFIKNLSLQKNRLYNLIMESLGSYYAENSIKGILRKQITQAEILFTKGMFEEHKKLILKAKKIALQREEYLYLLEIINLESRLILTGQSAENIKEKGDEEQRVTETISEYYHYKNLHYLVFGLASDPTIRDIKHIDRVNNFLNNTLLANSPKSDSVLTKILYYRSCGICYIILNDQEKSYEYLKKQEVLFNDPVVVETYFPSYITFLQNKIIWEANNKKYKDEFETLTKFKSLLDHKSIANRLDSKVRIYFDYHAFLIKLFQELGEFNKGAALIESMQKEIETSKELVSKILWPEICIHCANIFFGINNFKKAFYFLREIIDKSESGYRNNLACYARILSLIFNYKLENHDLLPYQIASTYRFLKKRNSVFKYELCLIHFLRKETPHIYSRHDSIIAFKKLKQQVEDICKDPLEAKALEYFDILSWLKAK